MTVASRPRMRPDLKYCTPGELHLFGKLVERGDITVFRVGNCKFCKKEIPKSKEFCSKECEEHDEARRKKREERKKRKEKR